jgi:copper oxidase (laccase) domain-containing protein
MATTTDRPAWIVPDWPAPVRVRALSTTRHGGVSAGPYGLADGTPGGLNLGTHVGDDPASVTMNRQRLAAHLPAMPRWLEQVHGCGVVTADGASVDVPQADASITTEAGHVCAIMTADCLPVLLCDAAGTVVGAAHAGWRGLCDGVIEATLARMAAHAGPDPQWMAWLGPAIGPTAFEVGAEVQQAFLDRASDGIEPRSKPHSGLVRRASTGPTSIRWRVSGWRAQAARKSTAATPVRSLTPTGSIPIAGTAPRAAWPRWSGSRAGRNRADGGNIGREKRGATGLVVCVAVRRVRLRLPGFFRSGFISLTRFPAPAPAWRPHDVHHDGHRPQAVKQEGCHAGHHVGFGDRHHQGDV